MPEKKGIFRWLIHNRWSPWMVMTVTGIMYLFKWSAKMEVGEWVHSPALIADGFHNLADLIEVGLVMFFGIYLGNKPKSGKYPMERKRIESVLTFLIGIALLVLAYETLTKSMSGLSSLWPAVDDNIRPWMPHWLFPEVEQPLVTEEAFWAVFLVSAFSSVMSFFASRYEIGAGKRSGMMSLVADGKETGVDGKVELGSSFGFAIKFGLIFTLGDIYPNTIPILGSCIEYLLGLAVAVIVLHTSIEIFSDSLKVLLALSIGEEKVKAIQEIIERVEGIAEVEEIKTFSDGTTAVCLLRLVTRASERAHRPLRRTLEKRISRHLTLDSEFLGAEVHVAFVRPESVFLRESQALVIDHEGAEMNAPTIRDATHLRIYDMDGISNRHRAVDLEITGMNLQAIIDKLIDKLIDKHVRKVFVFVGDPDERQRFEEVKDENGESLIHYCLNDTRRVYVSPRLQAVV